TIPSSRGASEQPEEFRGCTARSACVTTRTSVGAAGTLDETRSRRRYVQIRPDLNFVVAIGQRLDDVDARPGERQERGLSGFGTSGCASGRGGRSMAENQVKPVQPGLLRFVWVREVLLGRDDAPFAEGDLDTLPGVASHGQLGSVDL